jgi:predicted nucleic acid-binding protein
MVAYLDSSLVLRHILLGEEAIEEAFRCGKVITSELLEIECRRVLHRYRLQNDLDDEGFVEAIKRLNTILEGTTVLAMTPSIKQKAAGSFPVVIKTLDALHLASALEYIDTFGPVKLKIFSHDTGLNRCAAAMGIE